MSTHKKKKKEHNIVRWLFFSCFTFCRSPFFPPSPYLSLSLFSVYSSWSGMYVGQMNNDIGGGLRDHAKWLCTATATATASRHHTWSLINLPIDLLGHICATLEVYDFYGGVVPLCKWTRRLTLQCLYKLLPSHLHFHTVCERNVCAEWCIRLIYSPPSFFPRTVLLWLPIYSREVNLQKLFHIFPKLQRLRTTSTCNWTDLTQVAPTLTHLSFQKFWDKEVGKSVV